ncbi:MAG TPA: hypothetical protein PLD86_08850, partial [Vicinamibacteria bacterium]|nr:hypothetical protein [Vicinamibacteria bacterium]
TASAPLASSGGTAPNLSLIGAIGLLNGGTGATTAFGARASLGAAAAGSNADITSLSALSTPLSLAQGGTGSATQNFVDLTSTQSVGGNKTFTGANLFSATQTMAMLNPAAKGLVVKGAAGQSANLVEFQDSFGAVISWFDPLGTLNGNTNGNTTRLGATPVAATGPTTGQFLRFSGAEWEPATLGLGIAQGGTGASTASGALVNLGGAARGANADITSLSGLSTPLSIAQGGTGSATQNFVDLATTQTVGGNKAFTGTNSFGATQTMSTGSAAAQGIIVRGAASQTANLIEMRDSANAVLSSFGPTGLFNGSITGDIIKGGSPFLHNFGSLNTFLGANAGNFTITGAENTAGGASALSGNAAGAGNTALGVRALMSNTAGDFNTAVGRNALRFSTGGGNIALGKDAGMNLAAGSDNIYIGNAGVDGESGTIRIGTPGTQTAAFIAGTLTWTGAATGDISGSAATVTGPVAGSQIVGPVAGAVPPGYMLLGATPTPPPGFTLVGPLGAYYVFARDGAPSSPSQEIVLSALALPVNEAGTGSFTVALATPPLATVVVSVGSLNPAVAAVSPAALTFTPANYNAPQTVTVSGTPDPGVANDATSVVLTAAGAASRTVGVTVLDDDVQAILTNLGSVDTSEGGSTTFTVTLAFQPAANVTVTVSSSDPDAATPAPSTLTFTPADYATPQTVTAWGVQDADVLDESLSFSLSSPGVATTTVGVKVTDDDTQYILSSVVSVFVSEDGTATFSVQLTQDPSGTLAVSVVSSNTTAATVSPGTLTFNSGNYLVAQTVTVTGVHDANLIGETLTVTLSSPGVANPRMVTVTLLDTGP